MMTAEDRLSTEDRLEIQELIAKYAFYEDSGNSDAWAALFTTDGGFEGSGGKKPIVGQAALSEFARRRWAERPEARNRVHWTSNLIIEADGDGATAQSSQMTLERIDGAYVVALMSTKVDVLRRENGAWRFVRRTTVPDRRA